MGRLGFAWEVVYWLDHALAPRRHCFSLCVRGTGRVGFAKSFSIGDEWSMCVRGEVATGRRGFFEANQCGSEDTGKRHHQSRNKVTYSGRSGQGKKEFWFFKPVEHSADGWGTEKRNATLDRNTVISRIIHSLDDSVLCLQSFSLQLDQPGKELRFHDDACAS